MKNFRSQLDFLVAEGWTTPTITELVTTPEKWEGRTAAITFDDGYADNLAACGELQRRNMRATWFIVSGSIGQRPNWRADGYPGGRLLDAAELRIMQTAGMEIGSHTVSHVRLTDVDETRKRSELINSKAEIEGMLGNAISSCAYPYGAWDEYCARAVRESGYHSACTTRSGWALRDSDPYRLRRLTVFNTDTVGSLARKLYFGSNDVGWNQLWRYAGKRLVSRLGR